MVAWAARVLLIVGVGLFVTVATHTPGVRASAPATLVVDDDHVQCPDAAYTTIQAAVDAASAGDTVQVCPGTYAEGVAVAKALTIVGPAAGSSAAPDCAAGAAADPARDAVVTAGTAFSLQASNIDLSGFVLSGNTVGVATSGGESGYTITDDVFSANQDGIQLATSGVSASDVAGNCFRGQSRSGIHSEGVPVHNARIHGNAFVSNTGWGMFLGQFAYGNPIVYVDHVVISGNTGSGDGRFLELPGATNVVVDGNTASGEQTGIFLANNNVGTQVTNNTLSDGSTGIYISSIGPFGGLSNSGLLVSGNHVSRMADHGISTEAGASMLNSTVTGNTVTDGAANGIWIADGSSSNTLTANTLLRNGAYDCRDDTTGAGTAGTANTWSDNRAGTESKPGLCVVPNRAPTAAFTYNPSSGDTTTSFSFDGSSSSDRDGDPLTYRWDFGDGSAATGVNPSHTFASAGNYTVTLIVNDGHVDSAPATQGVSVAQAITNHPPTGDFTYSPSNPVVNQPVNFVSHFSDQDGDTLTYEWTRALSGVLVDESPKSGPSTSYTFPTPGTWTVNLRVFDGHDRVNVSHDVVVSPVSAATDTTTSATTTATPTPVTTTTTTASQPTPRHTLQVSKIGVGSVSSTPSGIACGTHCEAVFSRKTSVTLEAIPARGKIFAEWSGDCAGASLHCVVDMDQDRAVTAHFRTARRGDPVTLSAYTQGQGTVSTWEWGTDQLPVHCGAFCIDVFRLHQVVHVVAIPSDGFALSGWTGACARQKTWCVLTMNTSKATTAMFVRSVNR